MNKSIRNKKYIPVKLEFKEYRIFKEKNKWRAEMLGRNGEWQQVYDKGYLGEWATQELAERWIADLDAFGLFLSDKIKTT